MRIDLRTYAIFLAWAIGIIFSKAQTGQMPVCVPVVSIAIEAKYIQTDKIGNLYVVSKTNQLYKYNAEGKRVSTLNYSYKGNISYVDATNPLEIYLFYKELNLVVFLDNNLAYRGEMRLENYGVGQASAIARSYDNGVWAFDAIDLQLKKTDKNGENQQLSGNVRAYSNADKISVTSIYDNTDKVFVNDSANGLLIFDVFAHFLKTVPSLKGCTDLKVIGNDIYFIKDTLLGKYNLNDFSSKKYVIPEVDKGIMDGCIEKSRLYILRPKSIDVYAF